MKKKIFAALAAVVFVVGALFAYHVCFGGETKEISLPKEYIFPTRAQDMYKNADIVVIGRYLGDKKTVVQEVTGLPETFGTIEVETVLKGEIEEDTPLIRFCGGVIPRWKSLLEKKGESGFAIFLTFLSGEKITMSKDRFVNAQAGQRYLMFLGKSPEYPYYGVLADAYGMRPLDEEDRALSPDSQQYERIDFLLQD